VALGLNEFCAAVVYLLVDTDSTVWNVASGKGSLLSRGLQCLRVGYNVCAWATMSVGCACLRVMKCFLDLKKAKRRCNQCILHS
jgi:hypothetical protein